MLDLSVTIVTFNTDLGMLDNAVNSLLEESKGISISIVIADNGSNESYFLKLENQIQYNQVKIINTGFNGGYGYGHNYAESISDSSKYHLVMNADILIHKGSLHKMINYMNCNNDISILSPKVFNANGTTQFLNKREPTIIDLLLRFIAPRILSKNQTIKNRMDFYEMRDIGYDSNYDLPLVSGCFMLFDRVLTKHFLCILKILIYVKKPVKLEEGFLL